MMAMTWIRTAVVRIVPCLRVVMGGFKSEKSAMMAMQTMKTIA